MNVKELIKVLQNVSEDLNVKIRYEYDGIDTVVENVKACFSNGESLYVSAIDFDIADFPGDEQ